VRPAMLVMSPLIVCRRSRGSTGDQAVDVDVLSTQETQRQIF